MNIAVIGIGYVGLVTGACLAELGHNVFCINRHKKKTEELKKGLIPIYEPGLKYLVSKNIKRNKLFFTTDLKKGIDKAKVVFITVQTPQDKTGRVNLKYVLRVASQIGRAMKNNKIVVNKSTVPVGTARKVRDIIRRYYKGNFEVVSCPEFLREGSAVRDFFNADRIVIGCDTPKSCQIMKQIFSKMKNKKLITSVENAELIKYASNAFLATKISFINEIANICEKVGADVETVAKGMGLDKRIGPHFLKAGIGYGGSCFPKDVNALNQMAGTHGYDFKLLKAVIQVNSTQRLILIKKLQKIIKNIRGEQVTVLGLAFKNNTDDIRESAAIEIINRLQKLGARVNAYDPVAGRSAAKVLRNVKLWPDPYQACRGSAAVIIATEWPQFRRLDWRRIKKLLKKPILLDGRNITDSDKMRKIGYNYVSIGGR